MGPVTMAQRSSQRGVHFAASTLLSCRANAPTSIREEITVFPYGRHRYPPKAYKSLTEYNVGVEPRTNRLRHLLG